MGTEDDSIDQAVAERREKLRALKAAKELSSMPDDDSTRVEDKFEADDKDNLNLKFRNYLPHDNQLQDGKLAPPVLPKFEDPLAAEPPQPEKKEKPNWDLRRDVQKKLDKLERRTQKAMFKLMEEQEKQKESDGNIES